MNNQTENNEANIIEDLSAQNADEIKGGPSMQSKRIVVLKSDVAGAQDDTQPGNVLNHNETVTEDAAETNDEAVNDLPVNDEQEAAVVGGYGRVVMTDIVVTSYAPRANHNETVSVDSEADTQKLADLTIDGETESAIKGGLLLPAVQKVREAAAQATASGGMGAGKVSMRDFS
jgi:hypothetical protein